MDNCLQNTLGVGNAALRARLMAHGFTDDLESLSRRDKEFACKVATAIRKQGGVPATHMSVDLQGDLEHLVSWAIYTHTVQRPLNFGNATRINITAVGTWKAQLPSKDDAVIPQKFTTQSRVKALLEDIRQHLSIATSVCGLPLLYVVRMSDDLPVVDPGFGLPSFDVELSLRGRHDGIYWNSSNRLVWNLMRTVCHGTNAWNHIKRHKATQNGRGAFLSFVQTFMGADIQYSLRASAESTLLSLRFDGKSKDQTFDQFVGMLRDAFNELSDLNMSEETKVLKFKAAFQVEEFRHLHSMISANPRLRSNFDSTIAFVGEQIRSVQLQNGVIPDRELAALEQDPEEPPKKRTRKGRKGKQESDESDPEEPERQVGKQKSDTSEDNNAVTLEAIKSLEATVLKAVGVLKEAIAASAPKPASTPTQATQAPLVPPKKVVGSMTRRDERPTGVFYVDDNGFPISRRS